MPTKRGRLLVAWLLGLALSVSFARGWSTWVAAQTTGTVAPVPRQQFFDNNGVPLSGGFIYTYVSGGSTSAVTYQDAALTTPHTNPIVLDSAGRTPAGWYLAQTAYRFIVSTSANVPIYTQDNVQSTAYAAAQATLNSTCDGRITLTSGTAVTTTDVTAATTVYFTPYQGNRCVVYDNTNFVTVTFSELSLALGTDAANTNYDLFAYSNAGVLTLERTAWSGGDARATPLTLQDGVLVRSGAPTRRYLGTYRTTAVAGQTEDSAANRLVWNYQHRVSRSMRRAETTPTWTYTTNTFRQANASTLNALRVVTGLAETALDLTISATVMGSTTNMSIRLGMGEDSIEAVARCPTVLTTLTTPNQDQAVQAQCSLMIPIGFHSYLWLEQSASSGTTTWTGTGGGANDIGAIYGRLGGH